MVLRETDRVVREATARPLRDGEDKRRGKRPLSVSTDRIAYTAMRCARILAVVGEADGKPVDLAGGGRVAEVYPDAALREWGIWPDDWDRERLGYKGTSIGATKRRRELMKRLVARAGDWLAARPERLRRL